MNDAVAQRAADENIYPSKAAFIAHVHTHTHSPKESRPRYSPAKKPLFGKPHEQSSYSRLVLSLCVHGRCRPAALFCASVWGKCDVYIFTL